MADSGTLRVRRHRKHVAGDHSECRDTAACQAAEAGEVPALVEAVELELANASPTVRELGKALAVLASKTGAPAVAASRQLGQLLALHRGQPRLAWPVDMGR
jgi:hypothetical protein